MGFFDVMLATFCGFILAIMAMIVADRIVQSVFRRIDDDIRKWDIHE